MRSRVTRPEGANAHSATAFTKNEYARSVRRMRSGGHPSRRVAIAAAGPESDASEFIMPDTNPPIHIPTPLRGGSTRGLRGRPTRTVRALTKARNPTNGRSHGPSSHGRAAPPSTAPARPHPNIGAADRANSRSPRRSRVAVRTRESRSEVTIVDGPSSVVSSNGTATTENTGVVHDGAGLKGIAQPLGVTSDNRKDASHE